MPTPRPNADSEIWHARDSRLGAVVEKSWLLSAARCDANQCFEVFPDAFFGLGVVISDGNCQVIAGGPITERFTAAIGSSEIYWLRFRPGLLPRIADVRPADLVDRPGIRLDRMPGLDLERFREQMLAETGVPGRMRLVDTAFAWIGERPVCQDRRCRRMLEMIEHQEGHLDVGDLSREFGLSARTIQRTLADQVGLTPRQLILSVRLQRTLTRLQSSRLPGAELALRCGYADQSHMINDLKRRTGHRPGDL